MNNTPTYYNQNELWGQSPNQYQIQVKKDLLDLLPDNIESILDVGCGDGFITNSLPQQLHVSALDFSKAALQHVQREKIIASISALPYRDNAFSLVIANDVIEHIPEKHYRIALNEIQRVSQKFIIITVPFLENLNSGLTLCAQCGNIFHVNQHQRAFGVEELLNLFDYSWSAKTIIFSGTDIPMSQLAYRSIRARLGVSNTLDQALCPLCNSKDSQAIIDNNMSLHINTFLEHLSYPSGLYPNRSECILLFEKTTCPSQETRENLSSDIILKCRNKDSIKTIPSLVTVQNNQLLSKPRSIDYSEKEPLWIEYQNNGITYRLPNPERFEDNSFIIPLWFTPSRAPKLSSHDFQNDFDMNLLMLGASSFGAFLKKRSEEREKVKRLIKIMSIIIIILTIISSIFLTIYLSRILDVHHIISMNKITLILELFPTSLIT